jgi:signal transduction histidine kinase/ligand-binding sensor domain-containing protein
MPSRVQVAKSDFFRGLYPWSVLFPLTLKANFHRLIAPALIAAVLLCACGSAVALDQAKPLKQFGRQSWQSDTGLPQNTVRAIVQTPDGFIWMATDGGLVRFDAQEFRIFDTGNTRELPSDSVNDLMVDGQGALWIACAGGLARIERGRFAAVPSLAGLPADVARFADQAQAASAPSGRIDLAMPNGDRWVGTDAGLTLTSHGTTRLVRARSGVTAGRVLKLFRDREGAVWAAYDLGVARVVDGAMQEPIDIAGVLAVFEDREGDMWFGTDVGGATVLRDQAFSTLTTADGLSDDFVRAVFQDHAGTVWLGTNRGGLDRIAGDRIADGAVTAIVARPGGLSSNVVLALAEAAGDLWIGTPDGLNRLRDGKLRLFTTADGLPDDFVRSLYTDRDGSLWIGTRNGLSHLVDGRFTSYSRMDGLGGDLIGSILRVRDGTLWVATFGGLSRSDAEGFRNFTTKDGLGGDAITALAEDRGGTLWIAAHGVGLTRLRGGVFTVIPSAAAVLPREIYSLLADSAPGGEGLWMGSPKGVYRVGIAALNAFSDRRAPTLAADAFGVADGMRISECSSGGHPAAWRMADGSLWFATVKGAAATRPGNGRQDRVAPLVAIEGVSIDEVTAAEPLAGEALVVPPGRDRLSVHYAGLSFRAPEKLRYRYRLDGFDKDWVEAGVRRTAFYTNLPAGSYRFVVAASTGDGSWSEMPGEFRFTIRPRFYRTVWFYCLVAVFVALLAWLIYRARVRTVEAQYGAVLAERNRIAREIHDTLAQGYVGVSVQLELVTRMLSVSKDAAAQQLERTKELVRTSLAEARSSIWNLRAAGEAETLPARLAAFVRSRQQEGAAQLRFAVRGSFRPVEGRVEDQLLRIAQEAVSNALRHAGASQIQVSLGYDTGWLTLVVSDDGGGFDRAAVAPGHYGVRGIEERAGEIGARLAIETSPGAGTTVTVAFELSGREVERG